MPVTTRDAILGGKLTLVQPAHGLGYRMTQDAVLLAAFACEGPAAELAVDLGAGAGGVGLAVLQQRGAKRVVFVEIDPALAMLAKENLEGNGFGGRGAVVTADVAAHDGELADLIVCNPPFFPGKSGRPSQHAGVARARMGDVGGFIQCARRNLAPKGRACFVYPILYLESLLAGLRAAGLVAKRMRLVHPREDANARVALVEVVLGKPNGLQVQPPWFDDRFDFGGDEATSVPSQGARGARST